jgi:hypothetical protein
MALSMVPVSAARAWAEALATGAVGAPAPRSAVAEERTRAPADNREPVAPVPQVERLAVVGLPELPVRGLPLAAALAELVASRPAGEVQAVGEVNPMRVPA